MTCFNFSCSAAGEYRWCIDEVEWRFHPAKEEKYYIEKPAFTLFASRQEVDKINSNTCVFLGKEKGSENDFFYYLKKCSPDEGRSYEFAPLCQQNLRMEEVYFTDLSDKTFDSKIN